MSIKSTKGGCRGPVGLFVNNKLTTAPRIEGSKLGLPLLFRRRDASRLLVARCGAKRRSHFRKTKCENAALQQRRDSEKRGRTGRRIRTGYERNAFGST